MFATLFRTARYIERGSGCMAIIIWGMLCRKQVSRACTSNTSNYITQYVWDVIICPGPRYLLVLNALDMRVKSLGSCGVWNSRQLRRGNNNWNIETKHYRYFQGESTSDQWVPLPLMVPASGTTLLIWEWSHVDGWNHRTLGGLTITGR